MRVSLRGSLADEYSALLDLGETAMAAVLIQVLLRTNDPDIICSPEDGVMIIGLKSERGKFWPDW